jgi:hypothetical protein
MRKIMTNKKIVPAAVLFAVLFCGLIFTTCGKLETEENVYTITFIAEYSKRELRHERRVIEIIGGVAGENNGKILAEDEVYTGPGRVVENDYYVVVQYDAWLGEPVIVTPLTDRWGEIIKETQPVTRRTDGNGKLPNFPPNPGYGPEGYSFDGWFTQGNTRVTKNTIFTTNTRVHAVWKPGTGIKNEEGPVFLKFIEIQKALKEGLSLSSDKTDEVTVTISEIEALKPQTLESSNTRPVRIILEGPTGEVSTLPYLTISESGSLFTVGNNVTLVLRNARMQGNDRNTMALLTVNRGGKLYIGENSSDKSYIFLNGAELEKSGGGVTVNTGAYLEMNGGDIYQCSVRTRPYNDPNGWPGGGGVLVRGGEFLMKGGNIERCFGQFNGGGVLVDMSGKFTMTGGQIYDNSSPYGGGVSTYRGGLFIMEEGDGPTPTVPYIKENLARDGGGVFVDGGAEPTIPFDPRRPWNYRGMPSYDSSKPLNPTSTGFDLRLDTNYPGMAYEPYLTTKKPENDPNKKEGFYMRGGIIQENHSLVDGGGVHNYAGGIVCMTGGTIRNNYADDFGGGVANMGLYIMIAGTIQGNQGRYGGGVCALLNMFAFEGGTIGGTNTAQGNLATSIGGGVFVLQGSFFMLGDNTRITYNDADSACGGLAIYPEGNFTMAGGIISNNTSSNNPNFAQLLFFNSSDPKLLGLALYGKRQPDKVLGYILPGDPLVDHYGRFWTNPTTGVREWLINSYITQYNRDLNTGLVTYLYPQNTNAVIQVRDGHLFYGTGQGSKPNWVTWPEEIGKDE